VSAGEISPPGAVTRRHAATMPYSSSATGTQPADSGSDPSIGHVIRTLLSHRSQRFIEERAAPGQNPAEVPEFAMAMIFARKMECHGRGVVSGRDARGRRGVGYRGT
jgi:hypothetical protein